MTKNNEIEILLEMLNRNPKSLHLIMKRLGDIGSNAKETIPELISILKDEKEGYNGIVIVQTIAKICGDESLDYLIEILQNKSLINPARFTAAHMLGTLEEAEKAVKPLIEELKIFENDYLLRCDSAYALGKIGENLCSNKKFEKINFLVLALLDSFKEEMDEDVRTNIAMALRDISNQEEGANLIRNEISSLMEKEEKSNPLYYLKETREKCEYWFRKKEQ